jgi:hypothetical protein
MHLLKAVPHRSNLSFDISHTMRQVHTDTLSIVLMPVNLPLPYGTEVPIMWDTSEDCCIFSICKKCLFYLSFRVEGLSRTHNDVVLSSVVLGLLTVGHYCQC